MFLRLALRSSLKAPGFTAVSALTLAVAIGACTTLFSVLRGSVLRPLPYTHLESLVSIWAVDRAHNQEEPKISQARADFFRARTDIFSGIGLFITEGFTLTAGSSVEMDAAGLRVSPEYFNILGLTPIKGRLFSAEDAAEGAPATMLISDAFWKNHFAGEPDVIGRLVTLNHVATRIIGIVPAQPGVAFGKDAALNRTDILVPLSGAAIPVPPELRKMIPIYQAVARLALGLPLRDANAKLSEASRQFRKEFSFFPDAGVDSELRTLPQQILGNVGKMYWTLAAVVAAVLLIACANVANLFLARVSAHWGDIAVRLSLGATRSAITRQFFAQAAVCSLGGAALGVFLAWGGIKAIVALAGDRLPGADQVRVDFPVVLFSLGLSLFCAAVIALYPMWRASFGDAHIGLKQAGKTIAGGRATHSFLNGLVVMQVLLSVVLLTCAGLLMTSFHRLLKTDPGFAVESRAFGYINLSGPRYSTADNTRGFFQKLEEKLAQAPELATAGAVAGMPLSGGVPTMSYAAEDSIVPIPERPTASVRIVTSEYFRAMGIQLREGRFFTNADRSGSEPVTIVNDVLARSLFPHESAINKSLLTGNASKGQGSFRIVGVIQNVKSSGLAERPGSEIYVPHAQLPWPFGSMSVVVQGKPGLAASAVIPVLRRVLAEIDPTLVLKYPQTVDNLVNQSIAVRQLTLILLACFSGIALLLAAVGIYSVLAYAVAQRTAEMGIRAALGAQQRHIVLLVLSHGMRLVVIGLIVGLIAAAGVTHLMASMLYQVEPMDPLVLASMTTLFVAVALIACLVPSWRASRVDPVIALRSQ